MSGSLRVLLELELVEGRRAEFVTLWHEHAAHVSGLPDNHGQSLSQRRDNPNVFVIVSDWTDEAAFRAFERSEPQQRYLARLWPMRQRGGMTLLTVLADRQGAPDALAAHPG